MANILDDVKTYAAAEVVCLVGGIPISEFADDSMVSVAPEADAFEHGAGADGIVTVSVNADQRAVATITLKETSDSNAYMLAQLAAQRLARGRARKLVFRRPFVLHCPNTGEKIVSTHTIILNKPEVSKAKSPGDREWRILLPYAEYLNIPGV